MIVNRQDSPDRFWLPGTELGGVAPAAPPFSVLVNQPDLEVVVVSVVGEIDLLTAFVLRKHLSKQLAAGPRCLVIDLSHTSFLGVTALSVLIDATQTAAHRGIRLQLIAPKRPLPARALNIAGLNRLCDIVASGVPTSEVIEALRVAEAYPGSALDQPLNGLTP